MAEAAPGRDDDGPDRRWAATTAVVVGLVALVGLVVGANWVLTLGCGCPQQNVAAGATVESAPNASRVTVTWTSNQNAHHLVVQIEGDGEAVRVANTTGNATATGDGVRLAGTGDAVTYAGTDPAANTTVEVVVVAYPSPEDPAEEDVIVKETVHL